MEVDEATDARTQLVMSARTSEDLLIRAHVPTAGCAAGARALQHALLWRVPLDDGRVRVHCDRTALAFILQAAPDIARKWPAIFGDVDVPREYTLTQIAGAAGQTVSGVQIQGASVRLDFASGDALLIGEDGAIDWRAA